MDEPRPTSDEQKAADVQKNLDRLNAEYRPKAGFSSPVTAFATAGIELGVSVVVLTLGGWWLDSKLNSSPWLLLLGAAVGITGGLYRIIRTFNQLMK